MGWRTDGVGTRRFFPSKRFIPLLCLFSLLPPISEGEHILGPVSRQPPPADFFEMVQAMRVGREHQDVEDQEEHWFPAQIRPFSVNEAGIFII